jgi:nicotinamidase-related amidase
LHVTDTRVHAIIQGFHAVPQSGLGDVDGRHWDGVEPCAWGAHEGVPVTPTVNSASVIDLRAFVDPSVVPTLVLVDLQQEYIAAPRALALPHAPQALANCRLALTHARTKGFPVAFVRWLGRSTLFNRATPFSGWIEGFEPTGADMVFERDRPSCYSSLSFGEVMSDSGSSFVLAGFAGESACLATAIDAFHRGHRITYLDDAMMLRPATRWTKLLPRTSTVW